MVKSFFARLADFNKSLRANGIVETTKIIMSTLADAHYDKSIGMSTAEAKFVNSPLEYNGRKIKGSYYLPTRGRPFLQFLKANNFSKSMTFVDIGCGRGRVLWLAKEYGFKKVVGVEIDEELATQARNNLLSKGLKEHLEFNVTAMNVCDYVPESDQNLYYFYGPYISEADLKKAVVALAKKKQQSGLDQFIAFHCNLHNETPLDRFDEVIKLSDSRFFGNRFFLYKLAPVTRR